MQEDRTLMASNHTKMKIPHVLTVAGSDSGAGAGIQADLKACAARGVYCSTVITAVTAQNTVGVQGVNIVPEDFVAEQLKSVLSDMQVDVVKTGMLPSLGIISVLNQCLKEFPVRALVVDPVMVSTSGDVLAGPSILAELREELLHMADIITPNLKEASALLGGQQLETVSDMRAAAKLLHEMGPRNVLVKGGHLPDSSDAIDIFFDGQDFYELRSSRIKTRNTHGTGCSLASCIAAELAKGSGMLPAVKVAKRYVETALDYSKDIVIGNGPQGPFDHLLRLKSSVKSSCRQVGFNPSDLLLYAVTDSRMNQKWSRSITDAVKAAIEGGATIVQLRMTNSLLHLIAFMIGVVVLQIDHYNAHIGSLNITIPKRRKTMPSPGMEMSFKKASRLISLKCFINFPPVLICAVEWEKDAETREFLEAAKACLEICHSHGIPLLINDRIDIALACDADGVHVGQSDMPASVARTFLGPEKIIGVSCKTPEQAHQAWIDGADYIGCGGVFPTNTKANNLTVGLDGLKTVCEASKLPVVAIGGIGAANARAVMEIGAFNLRGVAVVSALFDRECILTETRKFHALLKEAASM
ncbi:Thiamine biosynthetic bifunctional enzyme TH1, chloroplastic [Morella rubra]|uniref:thiamine phosphate synthase n=1 Tax=Morella rubra TaxID=262757 RepID=A0A6A1V364_9ROSI|nr:Thiamine biosynthetic bifunctional enzyme TH1, chloroplastic [Morella rubra]